ncbi:DUF1963 domain-containing protein [Phytomonospora endophytica]|uniref:DUF1963 domain-containing protein n=1 Tax=Phytomonospora endophytica TaxID=714109 RepID=A0A841FRN7_9ACTN|nr:YwqG family protein [Phytomonospora endophytica]MBB6035967.1 hypothetical protein [Phytomonospora endophytica]GIG66873.1 hypothetical protein Pen01_31680 [Phytomonospora endophytica]
MSDQNRRIPPTTTAELEALAREHMPPGEATYWLSLPRPAIRLRHAEPGDATVGFLSGDPALDPAESWPATADGRTLTHQLTLDLAALPETGLDLPSGGLLQFFCFAPEGNDPLVRHIPAGTEVVTRRGPEDDIYRRDAIPIAASVEMTAPRSDDHPYVRWLDWEDDEPGEDEDDDEEPASRAELWEEAIGTAIPSRYHLVGGYGVDVQGGTYFAPSAQPVLVRTEAGLVPETELPVLLVQLDSDHKAGIGWGDMGIGHFHLDRADLAARRFDRVALSWSCF